MSPKIKLAVGVLVIVGATAYMAYVGAANSWQYYITADECLADSDQFTGSRVRISGLVAPGSLNVAEDRSMATFCLQGQTGQLEVVCQGPLPDNLDESMEVVVEGRCEPGGRIQGEKVLTRCASKYESNSEPGGAPVANQTASTTRRPE